MSACLIVCISAPCGLHADWLLPCPLLLLRSRGHESSVCDVLLWSGSVRLVSYDLLVIRWWLVSVMYLPGWDPCGSILPRSIWSWSVGSWSTLLSDPSAGAMTIHLSIYPVLRKSVCFFLLTLYACACYGTCNFMLKYVYIIQNDLPGLLRSVYYHNFLETSSAL